MRHEKVIPNELNDSKVKIDVGFYLEAGNKPVYLVEVYVQAKGQRKWRHAVDTNDYDYRKLSMADRREFENEIYLTLVTPKDIMEAKMELWNKMKPE